MPPRASTSKAPRKDPTAPKLPNPKSREFYLLLGHKRDIKPTKFLHSDSLISLGVLNGVQALFENIGWGNFLLHFAHTFAIPTKEFLSTFEKNDITRTITFQLQGCAQSLSYANVNNIMGTPTENVHTTTTRYPPEFANRHEFWAQISNCESFEVGRDKATDIVHPCLRIAHRILTSTIFARGESGQVHKHELFFLWCMTRPNGPRPDFASFFFHKCHTVRSKAGDICIGGLITVLASGLSIMYPSPPYIPVSTTGHTSSLLDIASLTRIRAIRPRDRTTYKWLCFDGIPHYVLPDPRIEDFVPHNPDTWYPPRSLDDNGVLIPEDELEPGPMHEDH